MEPALQNAVVKDHMNCYHNIPSHSHRALMQVLFMIKDHGWEMYRCRSTFMNVHKELSKQQLRHFVTIYR